MTINSATGQATVVGNIGFDDVSGIAILGSATSSVPQDKWGICLNDESDY